MLNGDNLKAAREEAGLTQKELSAAAGLGENAGYRLENNIDDPRFSSIIAVAELLDASLDFLAGRTNDPKAHKALSIVGDLPRDIQVLIAAMQRDDWVTVLEMVSKKVRQNFVEKPPIISDKPTPEE